MKHNLVRLHKTQAIPCVNSPALAAMDGGAIKALAEVLQSKTSRRIHAKDGMNSPSLSLSLSHIIEES